MLWGRELAETYDASSPEMFDPAVLEPVVDLLAGLAGGGQVLELAIGTGRVALPLAARGGRVAGIELSPHMVEQLREKPGADEIEVVVGDMTSARVEGEFSLVYLVFNTIMNVTTQEEQVAVFRNASAHLVPGGHFVVEVVVPRPGDEWSSSGRVFAMSDNHVGIDTLDDPIGQISSSHHWMEVDGRLVRNSAPFRFIWPSELVLMGQLAGFFLADRWSGWQREPFTAESTSQVAIFEKVG